MNGDKDGYVELQMESAREPAAVNESRKKEYIIAKVNNKEAPANLERGNSKREFDPSPEPSMDEENDREEDNIKRTHSLI